MSLFDVIIYPIPDIPRNPDVHYLPDDIVEKYEKIAGEEWRRYNEGNHEIITREELFKKYRSILQQILLERDI